MRKHLLNVAAALAVMLSAAGPAEAQPSRVEQGARSGGTLRVAYERWPNAGLRPQSHNWIPFFTNQFESLVKADDQENFHPWLAKSWTISEDGLIREALDLDHLVSAIYRDTGRHVWSLLEKVGIEIVVDNTDEVQAFAHRDKGDYSIFHVEVAGFDPGYSLNLLWASGGIINFSRLTDPQVDRWLDAQSRALTFAERKPIIDKIVDYVLREKKLVLPVVDNYYTIAASARVKNADTTFGALRNYPGPVAYDV